MSGVTQSAWGNPDFERLAERVLPWNYHGTNQVNKWQAVSGHISTTDVTAVKGADSAGHVDQVTDVIITNGSATTGVWVELLNNADGSVIFECYAAAGGGGVAHQFKMPLEAAGIDAKCSEEGADVVVCLAGYMPD